MSITGSEFLEQIFRAKSEQVSPMDFVKSKQELALNRISSLGFPEQKQEEWKYYDFAPVLAADYKFQTQELPKLSDKEIKEYKKMISHYVFPETLNNFLVTLNGAYCPELSSFEECAGLEILDFNKACQLDSHAKLKEKVLASFAKGISEEDNVFKAINTVMMQNGFLLYFNEKYQNKESLQILHISNQNTFNQIRSLIYCDKNSQAKVLVNDIGSEDTKYFSNTVVEIFLEANSKLKLDKIQNESQKSLRMYDLNAELKRDAKFDFNVFSFGAASSRDDIKVQIKEKGAEANIAGLYVLNDDRKSHYRVVVDHEAGNSESSQLFKGLLYDSSRAEFNGLINIEKDAQQVNAEQLNQNLLLSETARVDSRPQLNILADDVKASHGSTTGQINEEEIFYLQSRGIEREEAIILLTYSYCRQLISRIEPDSAKDYISKLAVKNLSAGLKAKLDSGSVVRQCLVEELGK